MTERSESRGLAGRIPPPLAFVAAFVGGWWLERRYVPGRPLGAPAHAAGIALMLVSAGLALWSGALFGRHRTTLVPHGRSPRMIVSGPIRETRNPLYVSLIVLYVGAAAWLEAWAALLLLPLPIVFLSKVIVPMEEAQLEQRFGDEYRSYRARVHRWL